VVAAQRDAADRVQDGPKEVDPDRPDLVGAELPVGRTSSTGFRALIDAETGAENGSLLHLLLNEIQALALVSATQSVNRLSEEACFRRIFVLPPVARARPGGRPLAWKKPGAQRRVR
jgi:hypothetical protein